MEAPLFCNKLHSQNNIKFPFVILLMFLQRKTRKACTITKGVIYTCLLTFTWIIQPSNTSQISYFLLWYWRFLEANVFDGIMIFFVLKFFQQNQFEYRKKIYLAEPHSSSSLSFDFQFYPSTNLSHFSQNYHVHFSIRKRMERNNLKSLLVLQFWDSISCRKKSVIKSKYKIVALKVEQTNKQPNKIMRNIKQKAIFLLIFNLCFFSWFLFIAGGVQLIHKWL